MKSTLRQLNCGSFAVARHSILLFGSIYLGASFIDRARLTSDPPLRLYDDTFAEQPDKSESDAQQERYRSGYLRAKSRLRRLRSKTRLRAQREVTKRIAPGTHWPTLPRRPDCFAQGETISSPAIRTLFRHQNRRLQGRGKLNHHDLPVLENIPKIPLESNRKTPENLSNSY